MSSALGSGEYWLYIILLVVHISFKISFGHIQCYQNCLYASTCVLSELNETCLSLEKGSCIPDYESTDGRDIKATNLSVIDSETIWIIVWRPPEDPEFHYNGFSITISTDERIPGKIYNYYIKVDRALEFKIKCSHDSTTKLQGVSVQTLPKSSVFPSTGKRITWLPGTPVPHINTTSYGTTIPQINTTSYDKTTYSIQNWISTAKTELDMGHGTIIAAVIVSVCIVVSIITGVAAYRFCRYKQIQITKEEANSASNEGSRDVHITDTNYCPVHNLPKYTLYNSENINMTSLDGQIRVSEHSDNIYQHDANNYIKDCSNNNAYDRHSFQDNHVRKENLSPSLSRSERDLLSINFD